MPRKDSRSHEIGNDRLTLADVERAALDGSNVHVPSDAWKRVDASRSMIIDAVQSSSVVYGVTTGFGALSDRRIPIESAKELQINLLRSHAAGTGLPLPDEVVRAMLLLRAHALALGYSGVRREVIEMLLALLDNDILPVVPAQGSVGASGDLAPLAHLALPVIGEGVVRVNGAELEAAAALRQANLSPITLEPKEALALINGTQAISAVGGLATIRSRHVLDAAIGAGALTVLALHGRTAPFDQRIQDVRPHRGQRDVAACLRRFLEGWNPRDSRARPVQDRYSIRAMPQVMGPVRDAIDYATETFETEINSATDNPLLFPDDGLILNGANFHGHPLALTCDFLKTAMASLATFGERRISSLVDPRGSGLPAFLAAEPGLNTGLMIPQYLAASLVSENRVLAHPSSVDSISTSADVEDYNSMGTIAARNLATVVENTSRVVAIELFCAAQALDLGGLPEPEIPAMNVYRQVRSYAPFLDRDRFGLGNWIDDIATAIRRGEFRLPETVGRQFSPDHHEPGGANQ